MILMNEFYTIDKLNNVSKNIIKLIEKNNIFTLSGHLGAGKTTLIQDVLKELGVKDYIASPTFTYVNKYKIKHCKYKNIYHFDLYRLITQDSFFELGFEEFVFNETSISFIEWPEVINLILLEKYIKIAIDHVDFENRKILIEQV